MEHPFKVEEFVPEHAAYTNLEPSGFVRAVPELESAVALPPLPNLRVSEVIFLRPSDPQYASYLPAANLRTQLKPALRAVCKTEHAVAVMIKRRFPLAETRLRGWGERTRTQKCRFTKRWSTPMRRNRSPCCARTASGRATVPPKRVMNSRRFS
jgi:hypothetical protein